MVFILTAMGSLDGVSYALEYKINFPILHPEFISERSFVMKCIFHLWLIAVIFLSAISLVRLRIWRKQRCIIPV